MRGTLISLSLFFCLTSAGLLRNRVPTPASPQVEAWLATIPPDQRQSLTIPGVVQNGVPVDGGSSDSSGTSGDSGSDNTAATASTPIPKSSAAASTPPPSTGGTGGTPSTGGGNPSNKTGSGTGAGGCPPGMKGVTFNGGYNAGQFDTIAAATSWLSFGLAISGSGSATATQDHVPMMAFASDVADAVNLVNGANPPEWLLTFNEPDYSYAGVTPTMSPQDAATAIQPLLKSPGKNTKFVAPVTADPLSDWVPQFFAACNCQSFFSAYNIHIYMPTSDQVKAQLQKFRGGYASDKPVWLTEVAPGQANPACSVGWDQAGQFMDDVYNFASSSGWLDRVFWNTGNQIPNDNNVCNSYLLDSSGNPSPLLKTYQAVTCGGGGSTS